MMDKTTGLEKQIRTLRKRSIFTLFLTWLALFFTIIGIAAGYKNFLRVHDKAKQAQDNAKVAMALMPQMASKQSIENWQREIRSQLVANQLQSSKELDELKSLKNSNTYIETTLRQQIEQLTQQQLSAQQQSGSNIQSSSAWQIAEVRFLLKTAHRHLSLNQDANTAIEALKQADQELILLGQPRLLPLRRLLAKDIANLQDYQIVDLNSVVATIDELSERLKPTTEIQTNSLLSDTDDPDDEAEKAAKETDSLLIRMKARLDETVVIKRYDNKLAQTIRGDTRLVRYELIRLKLETLKLLALKSQRQAYQEQLKQINALLNKEHTERLDEETLAILAKLESMQLQPRLPNILSTQLLDELLTSVAKEQL